MLILLFNLRLSIFDYLCFCIVVHCIVFSYLVLKWVVHCYLVLVSLRNHLLKPLALSLGSPYLYDKELHHGINNHR